MRPRLIHPCPVLLFCRKKPTDADPDLGPTRHPDFEASVELQGQIRYNKLNQMVPVGGGNDPQSDGHIVFQVEDWQSSGGAVGDEMELFAGDSRLIVTEVRSAAHYVGRAWHVHVVFVRKRATR